MSHILHRGKKEGTFSVWTSISDGYIFENMTREELIEVYKDRNIETAEQRAKEGVFYLFLHFNMELRQNGEEEIDNEYPMPEGF